MATILQTLDLTDTAVLEAVYALIKKAFPDLSLTLDKVRTELAPRIFGEEALYLAAMEDEQPVAFVGFIPHHLLRDGEELKVYQIVYVSTHPNHRGKGHFSAIIEEAASRLHGNLMIGYPNATSYPLFVERLGFHHIPQHYSFRFRMPMGNEMQKVELPAKTIGALEEEVIIYKRHKYGNSLQDQFLENRMWGVVKNVRKFGIPVSFFALGGLRIQNKYTLEKELTQLALTSKVKYLRAEYLPGNPLHRLIDSSKQKEVAAPFIWRSLDGRSYEAEDFALLEGLKDSF